ncbi:MAG: hypothetical protein OFPII_01700 [Osedax symbiont Rs1]|nr:MAG: hypothetical protein OFPII_01700 [Osedax symbiont Rs1]
MAIRKKSIGIFLGLIVFLCSGFIFKNHIITYYEFNHYCNNESGFSIYEKIKVNKVWRSSDYFNALVVARFNGVKSVKYTKPNNEIHEVYYTDGDRNSRSSYADVITKKLDDEEYELTSDPLLVGMFKKIKKIRFKITRVSDGYLMSEFFDYSFSLPSPDFEINSCHSETGSFFRNINKIFASIK